MLVMRKTLHFVTIFLIAISMYWSCEKTPTESTVNTPEVTTYGISNITDTTAQCGGTVTSDAGVTVTTRGVCWSTSLTPTISDNKTDEGTGKGNFTSSITGLTAATIYYARAYATNNAGTGYGSAVYFITTKEGYEIGTVTDIDGNIYQAVKIGTQWWMAENIKVTHYRNGDAIPNVTDSTEWNNLVTGAYCNYDNDTNNAATYGHLYNWYAVNDSRNIAPEGWHVPSDAEWQTLIDYLGGDEVGGGKMKETGTTHWSSPNTGATNESGFSALPGGYRGYYGSTYNCIGTNAYFWSSSESNSYDAWYRHLYGSYLAIAHKNTYKECGLSIRCVRD
jgi:uncharacterized protein (TIGR02145 family)